MMCRPQAPALTSEVIDDREDAEAAAVGERIRQEVEAPALIGSLWERQRRPGPERPLAATAATDLEPFLPVEPAQLLVVHADALPRQQDVQAPIATAPANGRQLAQPNPHGGIVWSDAAVANRGSVGSQHTTRPPFAHLKCHLEMSDGLAPRDGASAFF